MSKYYSFFTCAIPTKVAASKGDVSVMKDFFTLVVVPLFVALVTTLVDHWLDDR
ncbi:type I toxin-antitoxin system Fst family toxin [Enterococcus sp. AZ196]|uniref:type I toxin-antitoxin system Fst family toxin n=1 Tax=Enterococcus sp. AZ196 TaxID=2774659 RepID=UPI003D26ED97